MRSNKQNRIVRLSTSLLVAAGLVTATSFADDTEIYTGVEGLTADILPNVNFIIDTSGSMSTDVVSVHGVYDPGTTYSGDCDPDYVFWSANSDLPTCDTDSYDKAIKTSSFVCDNALQALTSTGFANDRFARYKRNKNGSYSWANLNKSDQDSLAECKADYGIHGDGGSNKYPADSNRGGPFRSNSSKSIDWSKTGKAYTFYSANYLNWRHGPDGITILTRLEIVQGVLTNLVRSTNGINAALMRFDQRSGAANLGGYFLYPMRPLTTTSRSELETAIAALTPKGHTPLSETLYEAARFFRGERVRFGNSTEPGRNVLGVLEAGKTAPDELAMVGVDDTSEAANTYVSPIEYQCQKNFVVLLTDGAPTEDHVADTDIQALPDFLTYGGTCGGSDNCLDELAGYLADKDQRTDMLAEQAVNTYTIGFQLDHDLLRATAEKGDGRYFRADDVTGLTDAFNTIINEILEVNTSFVAPSVPANAFNRLTHEGSLVYTVFRPQQEERWPGNLKRYTFDSDGNVLDANGNEAIDGATGFFKSTSKSFWTPAAAAADGDNIEQGGFASQLSTTRNLYTNLDGNLSNVSLGAVENQFHEDNAEITDLDLGVEGADERTRLMQWARGIDIYDEDEDDSLTDARQWVSDPLHSRPITVVYSRDVDSGESDALLFFGTNEGLIHAVHADTGEEEFAFLPWELLPRVLTLHDNPPTVERGYGIDGPFGAWINDVNGNGVLYTSDGELESGEGAYIYVTMRRGGRTIYALNVSDPTSPELMWAIRGGEGDAFDSLGQSWTEPAKVTMRIAGTEREVLLITGGYAEEEDDMDTVESIGVGNSLFIVDALTGELIWRAGASGSGANLELSDLLYSTPGGITALDVDGDGLSELAYMADTGGQIWRFDFDMDSQTVSGLATAGRFASLSGDAIASARRFFYRPDVSITQHNGSYVLALAIGSGFRAHPLDQRATNRFYVLFDTNLGTVPASYSMLEEDDLLDVTTAELTDTADSVEGLSTASGWYITLATGEKVLAEARTIDGLTFFTSYTPGVSAAASCSPALGLAQVYGVSTATSIPASGFTSLDGLEDGVTRESRRQVLVRGGIPPEPAILFPPDGSAPQVIVSTETVDDTDLDNPIRRIKWSIDH